MRKIQISSTQFLILEKGDLTCYEGAIVIPTSSNFGGTGSVGRKIYNKIGTKLKEQLLSPKTYTVGEAIITEGYDFKADHIIHVISPFYSRFDQDNGIKALKTCYHSCMDLAYQNNIHEISFPCIGTGFNGFPFQLAAEIAWEEILQWMKNHSGYTITTRFVCFGEENYEIYKLLFMNV